MSKQKKTKKQKTSKKTKNKPMLHFPLHCTARFLGVGISCPITQNLSLRHLLRVHHAWCNTLRHSVFITYPPAVAKYNGEVRVYTVQLKATREREGEREIRSSAPFPSLVTRSASSAVSPEIKRKKKKKKRKEYGFVWRSSRFSSAAVADL